MARPIIDYEPGDPGNDPGNPTPSDPNAPPGSVNNPTVSSPNTKLAKMIFGTSTTFTADEIKAAGGPWSKFKIRVTSVNNSGKSVPVDYTYTQTEQAPGPPTQLTTQGGTGSVNVSWRNPIDSNFGWTRVYRSVDREFANAVKIGADITGGLGNVQTINDVPGAVGQYFYFVRAFSNSGLASPVTGPIKGTVS